jgi:ankyrin repeat protein
MAQSKSQLRPPNELQEDELHIQNEGLSEAQDENGTFRIVHENTLDARLAADALTHMLLCFEETEDVESYKAALVTALRSNITISDLKRPHKQSDRFSMLSLLAIRVGQLVRGDKQINDPYDHTGETILHLACGAGLAESLEPLFWRGAYLDAMDNGNTAPLYSAISSGDIDTIRYALALGADPNLNRPLLKAYFVQRHDIVTLLVKYGADINRPVFGNVTLLSLAIRNNDLATFHLALSLGADPNVANPMGELVDGCLERKCNDCAHEEMAYALMDKGADISVQAHKGRTIFHYAVIKAYISLLRAVLDRNGDPAILDVEDNHHCTALQYATEMPGNVPQDQTRTITSMLLKAGARGGRKMARQRRQLPLA